jgi:hypothetical protein
MAPASSTDLVEPTGGTECPAGERSDGEAVEPNRRGLMSPPGPSHSLRNDMRARGRVFLQWFGVDTGV